jgi:ubiquitin C-terminal hydrolase
MHDYKCPKCNELNFTKTTELTLNSTILIVHINRFSFAGGETRKELPTKKIRRKIEGGY